MIHRKVTIVLKGKTESAIAEAMEAALRDIGDTGPGCCISGHNSNDEGAYYFDVSEDVPRKERAA